MKRIQARFYSATETPNETSSGGTKRGLTHAFLFKGEPAHECIGCQSALTIRHILLDCVDFMAMRQQFYRANGMPDLFTKVKQENILTFLRAAGLYHLIYVYQLIAIKYFTFTKNFIYLSHKLYYCELLNS